MLTADMGKAYTRNKIFNTYTLLGILMILGSITTAIHATPDTDLFQAIGEGNMVAAQNALQQGAKPNLLRDDGYTPLLLATSFGHIDIVTVLLEYGANINMTVNVTRNGKQIKGLTALMVAAGNGMPDMVNVLLHAHAKEFKIAGEQPVGQQEVLAFYR
jgi:ankyrin repeat protein